MQPLAERDAARHGGVRGRGRDDDTERRGFRFDHEAFDLPEIEQKPGFIGSGQVKAHTAEGTALHFDAGADRRSRIDAHEIHNHPVGDVVFFAAALRVDGPDDGAIELQRDDGQILLVFPFQVGQKRRRLFARRAALGRFQRRLEALGVELGFRCDITPGILILDGVERFLRSGKIVEPFRLDTRNAKQSVVGQHMAGVAFEEHPIPIDRGLSVLPQHGTLGELLHRQRRTEERRRAVPPAGIFFVEVEKRLGEFFPRLTPATAFGVALEKLHILLGLLVLLFKGGSRVRVGKRGHEQGEGKGDQKGSEQTPDGGG